MKSYEARGLVPDYDKILRRALFMTFIYDIIFLASHAFVAESAAVFYSYYIGEMILFIKDKDASYTTGIRVLAVFGSA